MTFGFYDFIWGLLSMFIERMLKLFQFLLEAIRYFRDRDAYVKREA